MPRINLILCSGVFIINTATLFAQTTPAYGSFTKATQYQFQQQKQWQLKQLPSNSVLYKFNSNQVRQLGFNLSSTKNATGHAVYTPITASAKTNSFYFASGPMMSPELRHYLQANQSKYSSLQKQAWWRDPAKGFGASMVRDYLQNNKSLLHL